jgi:hypothetical protein
VHKWAGEICAGSPTRDTRQPDGADTADILYGVAPTGGGADASGGMRAGAPAEIFGLFRAAAEGAIGAEDYDEVAARLGLD